MNKFVFIIPSYNNIDWYNYNLSSILNQAYTNWRIIYINDCSTDNTIDEVNNFVINQGISDRFTLINNTEHLGPTASRYYGYQQCEDNEICCMLDGDDWLYDKNVLAILNDIYNQKYNYTYGGYYSFINGKIDNWLQPKLSNDFPYNRKNSKWFCQHLRSVRAKIIKSIPISFLQIDGEWIKCGSDMAESIYILEYPNIKPIKINKPLYVYNRDNSIRYPISYYRKDNQEYRNKINTHIRSITT